MCRFNFYGVALPDTSFHTIIPLHTTHGTLCLFFCTRSQQNSGRTFTAVEDDMQWATQRSTIRYMINTKS